MFSIPEVADKMDCSVGSIYKYRHTEAPQKILKNKSEDFIPQSQKKPLNSSRAKRPYNKISNTLEGLNLKEMKRRLIVEGETVAEIAKTLGIRPISLSKYLNRKFGNINHLKTTHKKKIVQKLLLKGVEVNEILKVAGISMGVFYKWKKKNSIKKN